MKGNLSKFWPIFLIIFINLIFFLRLFVPEVKIFVTPDFGLSDILHFNYPVRFVLSEFLKSGRLPLWVAGIGGGFPLFATGQTGVGNIIVFLTTLLFPPAIGFNLTYVFACLLMGVATYLFARLWGLTKIASLFTAIVFSFSGSNITHFAHTDHLLTVAFIPLCFYTLEQALRKGSARWWLVFSFAGSQCLLAGNANAAVYGFFALGVYFVWRVFLIRKRVALMTAGFVLAILLLLGLSAVQLLPSWELTQTSQRGESSWAAAAQKVFPYPPKHLLTFLNPYLLGDPHKATYPMYGEDWGLFWENTAYIGVIPLLLTVFTVVWGIKKMVKKGKKEKKVGEILFWAFLAVFTLLLSLGKYAPLFYLLKLPPLNLFRIPSTFLFVTDFALAMLAGYGLEVIQKKLSLLPLLTLFTLSLLDLFWFSYNYNPIGKAEDWGKPPETAEFLGKDTADYRIFSPLSAFSWNKVFENYGWQDDASEYLTFKNMLASDMNLLWHVPTIEFYTGVAPERMTYFTSFLVDTFQVVDHGGQKELLIADSTLRMLNLNTVKYIVTPGIINHPDFKLVFPNIYENLKVWPRARIVCGYEEALSLEAAGIKLLSSDFDPAKKVVLEKIINFQLQEDACSSEAKIVNSKDSLVEINVKMKDNGILVLGDSFYPGWKAKVDGKESEIFAANINQRAVILPKGEHKVEFSYEPTSFKAGLTITLLSWGLVLVGVITNKSYEKFSD